MGAPAVSERSENEVRCICKRLVFVFEKEEIQIKCNKCKRIIRIETKGINRITRE